MTTKFNHCPNCHKKPDGGFWGSNHMKIYECKKCRTCYCYKCGDKRCPNCGSKEYITAGECWK